MDDTNTPSQQQNAARWAEVIDQLPNEKMKFSLYAVHWTIFHSRYICHEKQTLVHVLNAAEISIDTTSGMLLSSKRLLIVSVISSNITPSADIVVFHSISSLLIYDPIVCGGTLVNALFV